MINREQAIVIIKAERECVCRQGRTGECCRDDLGCGACDLVQKDVDIIEAYDMAIKALMDNKPSRTWIAKNEYRRGWHDAITRALSEVLKIHVGNEIFDMVQKETLIGLGLSMDSALGAEPYSETEQEGEMNDQNIL